jgi:hypothetical protein
MLEQGNDLSPVDAAPSNFQIIESIFRKEVTRAYAISLSIDGISDDTRNKLMLYSLREDTRGKTRIAQTRFRQNEIGINTHIIQTFGTEHGFTEANLLNTLRHEIAHVLTPWSKHNGVWKAVFVALGGDGKRLYTGSALRRTKKVILQCVMATATLDDLKDAAGHFHRLRHKKSPQSYLNRKRCNLRGCGGRLRSFRPIGGV